MTYKAIVRFTDLQDDGFKYNPGDIYPRAGLSVTPERIKELASKNNRRGMAVIKKLTKKEAEAES